MELLECLCMSECVCSVNCFYNCSPSKTYLFSLIFLRIFFFFFSFIHTLCDTRHTCMCAVALCSIPTARVVHIEFFCEVSFVFYLRQWGVCWLTTSSWSGDLAFLFCWADSFSVILFFSLSMSMAVYCSFISSSSQSWY